MPPIRSHYYPNQPARAPGYWLSLLLLIAFPAWSTEGYQVPPDAIMKLVDAPLPPRVRVSPSHTDIAFLKRAYVTSIEQLAQDEAKLAGLRIRPWSFSSSRGSSYESIKLTDLKTLYSRDVPLPKGRIFDPQWSPRGDRLALVLEQEQGLVLWVYQISTDTIAAFPQVTISGIFPGRLFQWVDHGDSILTRAASNAGKTWQPASRVPDGPTIQVTGNSKAPVRTYQDLLKNALDADFFEFLALSQVVRIELSSKQVTSLNKPAIYRQVKASPDGQYIMATRLLRPFSYLVPYYRFAQTADIWRADGQFVKTASDLPVADNLPKGFDSVVQGRRDPQWRLDHPASLIWFEAQDGGDMKTAMKIHDIAYQWSAPFKTDPAVLYPFEMRATGFEWGNEQLALAGEWRFSDRRFRETKFSPGDLSAATQVFQDRSYNDEYADPGFVVTTLGEFDTEVMLVRNDGRVYLQGQGASERGYEPFLDSYDFDSGEKERLWQSSAPLYERVVEIMDDAAGELLISRESPDENPNYFLLETSSKKSRQITRFPHPTPEFVGLKKELIRYQRADGVELSGTLYLPPGYKKEDGPIPVLMWAYPLEYKDSAVAGQIRESPYQFNRIGFWGPLPYLAQGIAVFDNPKMPIVGAGDKLPNDSFRSQLVASAQAAIDVLVEKGIADPKRVAIAGHSYGAFMVGNLLAHSDLFAAGIARSGAYNRSLTPFGFQGEERDFWEAQPVYANMSPFFHAEKINEPLLMIHGEMDNNSGTYPLQSKRMFAALKGLGGNARLVMLPLESHGYRARESILHMLYEQHRWLDQHVINAR